MKTSGRRALAALLALVCAAGCSGKPSPGPTPSASGAGPSGSGTAAGTLWIVSGSALTRLRAADPDGATTRAAFDSPDTFVLAGGPDWPVPAGWTSTPTASFTSYASLRSALTGGTLDPRIKAVLYDNEHWDLTPILEQREPARYDQLAAQLAHQHHLLFIATPAINLVNVLTPIAGSGAGGNRYQAFLDLGLAGQIARTADVIDVQSQSAEADINLFSSFVQAAAAQARKANPAVKVLAGISTNASGDAATAAAMDQAAASVRKDVDGYWLNDPEASTACPACVGPFPQVALDAVKGL
ncbi:MAG TPA: hypothetical protein VFU73_07820 [Actinocrinis sp.]|nr:hypothetical protein [Actinocrinis sp.]